VTADDGDKLKEECGVFGVIGRLQDASNFVALGLHALLQHRGQEAGRDSPAMIPTAGFQSARPL